VRPGWGESGFSSRYIWQSCVGQGILWFRAIAGWHLARDAQLSDILSPSRDRRRLLFRVDRSLLPHSAAGRNGGLPTGLADRSRETVGQNIPKYLNPARATHPATIFLPRLEEFGRIAGTPFYGVEILNSTHIPATCRGPSRRRRAILPRRRSSRLPPASQPPLRQCRDRASRCELGLPSRLRVADVLTS
jgi:hypothetical protein